MRLQGPLSSPFLGQKPWNHDCVTLGKTQPSCISLSLFLKWVSHSWSPREDSEGLRRRGGAWEMFASDSGHQANGFLDLLKNVERT